MKDETIRSAERFGCQQALKGKTAFCFQEKKKTILKKGGLDDKSGGHLDFLGREKGLPLCPVDL